ncbi:hypothetical protein [Caulobacter segnis]|uniref:hypothetical protein n=1 Tax=Caulobacter segnis TaxID=88688 RepID=UPI002864EBCB|nr:hypothetical protein [Caulobacter segnis]MDR6623922.1 hypothetical protein [Caulobacter segnis]
MTGHSRAALVALAALTLAACSPRPTAEKAEPAPAPATSAPAPTVPASAPAAPSPTVGGDGSPIQLSGLGAADMDANSLEGELGCSFSAGNAPPLLIAKGDVGSRDPAFGLVKVGDYVERVAAPGGFDGMLKGATFSGAGKTVTIAVTGPASGGGESPPRPATLTYDRADGARRVIDGEWTCGP